MLKDASRLKLFLSYYSPYRLTFALDASCALAANALALAFPLCVRSVTDALLSPRSAPITAPIIRTSLVMLGIIALKCACVLYSDWQGHAMGARMEGDMRRDIFARLQRLPVSFFDREKTGALMSRVTSDLLNLAEIQHHCPEDLLSYTVILKGAIAIMARMSAPLTLALTGILAVTAAYAFAQSRKLRAVSRDCREKIAEMNANIEDALSGIRDAKAFASEPSEAERFRRANAEYTDSRVAIYKREAYYYTIISELCAPMLTVTALAGGAFLIARGSMSVPDLIAFLIYVGYFAAPMLSISRLIQMIQAGMTGFKRFADIIETPAEPEGGSPLPDNIQGRVEFQDVRFRYGEGLREVLSSVSFIVEPSETVALTGASGAGKTTIASLIPRFYEPDSGRILIDGIDARGVSLDSLRRAVGYVRQDTSIFLGTVCQNIEFGRPGASREEVVDAARRAAAHGFIEALPHGYDTYIGQRGVKLSGGQRQRIALARLFLKNPKIIILDEATSALDTRTDDEVRDALAAFAKEGGRTMLIIAHRMDSVKRADRMLRLADNGVIEEV
ncbi:MAG: ABC transporter ATP-binding protein/permease [Oscillospiraceae bacterium]|jgi:ATP-binding cassette subfamily B protein|nr:ABC transporter ATP-binding protein/permease [Oscillospiraceae bacterium]